MARGRIYGTVYLLTVERGDYHTHPVTLRVYSSNEPGSALQKLLARLDRHYKKKPERPLISDGDTALEAWFAASLEWESKHPIPDEHYRNRDDFKVVPMEIR